MNLDTIQDMWSKDSVIDPDELHNASLAIPNLHSKYFQLYNDLKLLRAKAKKIQQSVYHEMHLYYSGKAEPDVYVKDPFHIKVREKDALQRYLDADTRLTDAVLKVEYYDVMLNYLEEIIKTIQNRTFQIKNAIDWQKFIRGYDS